MIFCIGSVLKDFYFEITDNELIECHLKKGNWHESSQIHTRFLTKKFLKKNIGWSLGGSIHNTSSILNNMGIKTYNPNDKLHKYGNCLVLQTPDKERTFLTSLGASQELELTDHDKTILNKSEYLFIEGYFLKNETSFKEILNILILAKKQSKKIILSLSDSGLVHRFKSRFHQLISHGLYMLLGNQHEFESLDLSSDELKNQVSHLYKTLGSQGSSYNNDLLQVAIDVQVVDKNGAGDSFAAGVIYSHIKNKSIAQSLSLGAELSALIVSIRGTQLPKQLRYYSV